MGKIIAIANQKGGVGKTTTAVNLCASLNHRDKKVLLIDCDPQGNATTGMGVKKGKIKSIYDVMFRDVPVKEAVTATKYGSLLGARPELAGANVELVEMENRTDLLKEKLEPIRDKYQYILIDCPPSLELLTVNALGAADTVLIPVQTEFYALEGLSDLIGTVRAVRQRINPDLQIEGLVMTMYDKRTKLSTDVEKALRESFPDLVYETMIPRNIRLSEAPSHGKPCLAYDKSSKGTKAYLHLANEFLKKQKGGKS
ncbi:MAG: ParA family protein [Oscillospiraceae bacterium]|nr:ParA family protein [Oscillospiraceae bacterium]